MEAAMAGAVVGVTIKVVLQNLLLFSMEETGFSWNFDKDLQKLKESLLMIGNFLEDAEMKQVATKSVQLWLMRLEAVAFNADYVFDKLQYQLLRKKVEKHHKMKKKVISFFLNSNPIAFRFKIARNIKNINKELKTINQEASELGLQMRIADAPSHGPGAELLAYLETDSFSEESGFVGRENDVKNLVRIVTTAPTVQAVNILTLLGMGGLGKTTLTREVFKDANVTSHFGKCIWVHVGMNFDPVVVLKKTLESLTGKKVDGSREVILRKLRKSFGDKKYLLVLDNFWDEDKAKWESFINSMKGISHVKGNVIMVTARKGNVASIEKKNIVYVLGFLSKDHCWSIIKARVYGKEYTPMEFEIVGKNIANKCRGLPLAAQVVGSLLTGKSIDEWVSVDKEWHSKFGGNENLVTKILKLSYDHLSSPSLKKCFAFCSLIPKGCWIGKNELIQLWMAEQLLEAGQEKDLEIVGNRVFHILIESSLLQVYESDFYRNITVCIMHDFVHDLASSVLNSRYLDSDYKVRYISRHIIDESSPIREDHAKCVRALFFSGQISHIMFLNLKCLHVLVLNCGAMEELPIDIGKLISLRYLDISQTKIKCLPNSIGDLYLLQTLRATVENGRPSYLEKLPVTFKFLISLRHLYIPNIDVPPEIGKLISLQTLPYFKVSNQGGCQIAELGSLRNLKGFIEIHNLEKVRDKEEAKSAGLFHKPNILKLKLVWNDSRDDMTNDENVLEGLQPNWNLKSLEIRGFKGRSFPSWTSMMGVRENLGDRWIRLDNLLEIQLSDCKQCTEVPRLGHLRRLKSLNLCSLPEIRFMGSSFYGIQGNEVNYKEKIIVFPALEKLELNGMLNLTAWTEVELSASCGTQPHEVSVFPCLKYLKIINCMKLMIAPSHFPSLKELEIHNMKSGLPLANICGSSLTSLTKLKISALHELVCLPHKLFSSNQGLLELDISSCDNLTHLVPRLGGGGSSLRKLKIIYCSNIKELSEDLRNFNALEELRIWRCPNLISVAYPNGKKSSSHGFPSLGHLEIRDCTGLRNLPCEMIESCAPSLQTLNLSGSKSLTNFPQVMSLAHKMPRLTMLGTACVPKSLDMVAEIGSLCRLQYLSIGGSSCCLDYASFKMSLDCMFPVFQRLGELELHGKEEWDSLPDQLQHLTTLLTLYLLDFGIIVLPEWFGRLSSLRRLALYGCQKLRHLASKNAMQGITKLSVINCPLLKKNLGDDSEWSKIPRIPYIWMGTRRLSRPC